MAVFKIQIVIEDGKEKESMFSLFVPDTYTIAEIEAATPTIRDIVQGMLKGAVKGIYLSYELFFDVAANPDPDSDYEERAKFKWLCGSTGHTPRTEVMAFNEDYILPSRLVDLTSIEVIAFIGLVAGGFAGIDFCDYRGVPITNFVSAEEKFIGSKRKKRR